MTAVVTSFTLGQALFRGPGTLLSTTRARPGLLRSPQQMRGLLVAFDSFHASLTARALRDVKHDRLLHEAHNALAEQLRLLESGKATREGVRQEIEFLARQLGKISDPAFKAAVAKAKRTGLNLFADPKDLGASVRGILEGQRRGPLDQMAHREFMKRSVDSISPSAKITRSLNAIGIRTIGGLLQQTEESLLSSRKISRGDIARIKMLLEAFGLHLKSEAKH